MSHNAAVFIFLVGLASGMLFCLEVGLRLGRRNPRELGPEGSPGSGPLEGAIFGLLGLLVAFTFSGAANRLETRRQLIVQEANAIGTAYLRIDLLPDAAQAPLRAAFRAYVDARLRGSSRMADLSAAQREFERANELQRDIWRQAVAASKGADAASTRLLIPALNDMFDITITRQVAAETQTPNLILGMLGMLALLCSYLAGEAMAKARSVGLVQRLVFPFIFAVTVFVILDLEYPRSGFIRIDAVDQVIVDVRNSMQ